LTSLIVRRIRHRDFGDVVTDDLEPVLDEVAHHRSTHDANADDADAPPGSSGVGREVQRGKLEKHGRAARNQQFESGLLQQRVNDEPCRHNVGGR